MNYILIYSIEGKASNTEKNFYEGLNHYLEKDKIKFISMDKSTRVPNRDFSVDEMSIKEEKRNDNSLLNVWIFVIHDDDSIEQRKALDITYEHVEQRWIKSKEQLKEQDIIIHLERIYDQGKSFDFLIWSFIGSDWKTYSNSKLYEKSKIRTNKQFFNNILRESGIDFNDDNLIKLIHDKITNIPSNHSKIIDKLI